MKRSPSKFAGLIKRRGAVQALATFLTNPHLPNFLSGTIYTGQAKAACVPGLNCYSCPAATGACPIGSFQAVVGSSKFSFSYYITGILIFIGVILGRFVCGFLCPFGWFQDLLHKIPFPKKLSTKRLKPLRYVKYAILIVMVWALPALLNNNAGLASPYFCKYVCPQGILEGAIPLSLASSGIRAALGKLFTMKFSILVTVVLLSIMFYRPFCKWICPLGAFYSLFNKVSVLQYHVDKEACVSCGRCARTCKMDVDITKDSSHLECIRCGECLRACPVHAIDIRLIEAERKLSKAEEPSTQRP
ncbi:4Fe-4S binding protein [Olsenella urininfantis]|uniref:4Fe-4S binding protein n=1 Tax=Olsenella urininfantis TaxID=1871033 RepID=UPI000986119D|nr:4Fe-4S binding protein [Olsenella urininfantis]